MRQAMFVAVVLLAGAVPGRADQAAPNPSANAQLGALRQAAQADPYRRLFEVRDALRQAVDQQSNKSQSAPRTTIVCGMTVIEVGSEIDPKMGVTPPKDATVRHVIRAIDPPICKP